MISELGGAAMHAGLQTRGLPGYRGRLSPRAAAGRGPHRPTRFTPRARRSSRSRTRTTAPAAASGRSRRCAAPSRRRASSGSPSTSTGRGSRTRRSPRGVPAAAIGGMFDTVTLCLSKGLGCPLGAVIAGSAELMAQARIEKHRFGGAMRQAGIVAAAGVYALEHNVERLADDHARALRLAEGWASAACRSTSSSSRRTSCRSTSARSGSTSARGDRAARRGRRRPERHGRGRACSARSRTSTSTTRTSTARSSWFRARSVSSRPPSATARRGGAARPARHARACAACAPGRAAAVGRGGGHPRRRGGLVGASSWVEPSQVYAPAGDGTYRVESGRERGERLRIDGDRPIWGGYPLSHAQAGTPGWAPSRFRVRALATRGTKVKS